MHKLIPGILLAAIIALVVLSSQAAFADTNRPLMVFLIDRVAVSESEDGTDLVKSVLGLVSTLRDEQPFAFISVSEPANAIGPILPSDQEFKAFQDGIDDWLASTSPAKNVDLLGAIAEASSFMGSTLAPRGSTIYLITDGSTRAEPRGATVRLTSLSSLFQDNGWALVGLGLPEASGKAAEFLGETSEQLGGESFELSVPDGFKSLTNKILKDEAKGALTNLGGGTLSPTDVLASQFSIVPGTREANLLVFKESSNGSLRLSNPSGFEASAGDRASSFVIETPFVVIWRLIDPAPGEWQVNVRGVEGSISTSHYAVNKYTPVLEPIGPMPLNEPATLTAFVTDGQRRAVGVEGVQLTARVTSPEGVTVAHELNDRGVSGDAIGGDGYYSATIPPVSAEGQYIVELELSWPEFDHRITSQGEFTTQAFPIIDVTILQTDDLKPGVRAKIADVLVHIQGQPYAVPIDQITGSVASLNANGILEVKPERLLDQSRAWSYEVFFTPEGEALHTIILGLSIEYLGRQYTYSSASTVLSSVLPSQSVQPIRQLAVASAPAAPPPVIEPVVLAPGSYWGLLAIPIVILVLIAAWVIYWLTRSRPYGFLYNDRSELIVDFANLNRGFMRGLFSKNSIWGKELNIPGFEGLSFNFARRRIDLYNRQVTTNVRVNNHPLIGQTPIQDRTWIGTQGKLYSFLLSSSQPQPLGGAAGDGD